MVNPFWSPFEEQSIFHSIFKEFSRAERSKKKLKIPEHVPALTNCGRNFVCFLLLIFFQKCRHRHSPECLKEIKKFICIQIHSQWYFGLSKSSVTGENGRRGKKVENKAFPRLQEISIANKVWQWGRRTIKSYKICNQRRKRTRILYC